MYVCMCSSPLVNFLLFLSSPISPYSPPSPYLVTLGNLRPKCRNPWTPLNPVLASSLDSFACFPCPAW